MMMQKKLLEDAGIQTSENVKSHLVFTLKAINQVIQAQLLTQSHLKIKSNS